MRIRQRLYTTSGIMPVLIKRCLDARFLYNLGLEQRHLGQPSRLEAVTYLTQVRDLSEARKGFPWLAKVSSSARVILYRSSRCHITLIQPESEFQKEPTRAVIGLDLIIPNSLTTSDGLHIEMSSLLSLDEAQLKRGPQHRFAKEKKVSNARASDKLDLATLSAKEADRLWDWTLKSSDLLRDYDLIDTDDLRLKNVSGFARGTTENQSRRAALKRGLNRAKSSKSGSYSSERSQYKASTVASLLELIPVNPQYTSKTCSQRGNTGAKNHILQAVFAGTTSGHSANSDINAVRSVLAVGLGSLLGVIRHKVTSQTQPTKAAYSDPAKRQSLELVS